MSEHLPSVTVVIAARPGQGDIKAVAASRALDYPADKLEVIVARGKQPSVQRNAAMRAAKGELLYFLDDDSVANPGNLRKAIARFADSAVQMVGGPNLCPREAPPLEQVFARVLACKLAFGPSRARYASFGEVRESSEKELILCNLMARRAPMMELGGFNEALYPNEENALMDELQKRGGKLIYDPAFIVERRPRSSMKSFARMLMTYGRGRAEQFRLHPTFGSLLNLVPPLFDLYLVLAAIAVACGGWGRLALIPLGLYLLMVIVQGLTMAMEARPLASLAATPLIVLTHILYGFGFWRGLFTPLQKPKSGEKTEVVIERVKPFAEKGKP